MNELTVAICDDEAVHRDIARDLLRKLSERAGVDYQYLLFSNVEELLATPERYDILLLDVRLGQADGIETAMLLRQGGCQCPIIFMSMLEERAVDGYKAEGFRYLVKPLRHAAFDEAILAAAATLRQDESRLLVRCADGNRMVWTSNILYLESYLRNTRVVTTGGTLETKMPLSRLRSELPTAQFGSPHNSFVVSFAQLERFDSKQVEMADGSCIPISANRRKEFLQAVASYLRRLRA